MSSHTVFLQRAVLVIAAFVFLIPVLWLFSTAYKPAVEIFSYPPTLAFTPTLDNFRTIADYYDLPNLLVSSLYISIGTTVLALLIGVPAGYALARSQSRWAMVIVYGFLAVRMMPPVATMIPFYMMMRDIGLLGTGTSVILIQTTSNLAFVLWLMFSSFKALPGDIEEAGRIDGCSEAGVFFRVALPLVVPGIIASALLCLILSWNDFLYPAFLTRSSTQPLSVALLSAYGTRDITWGTMGALAHLSTLPIILITFVLNRYFVRGLTAGSH